MKILVIGSGGREHAVIRKLKENSRISKIYCAPGNGGISKDAECVNIAPCDKEAMAAFCVEQKIDFAVVTPDDPLVAGMVDALNEKGIRTFGPDQKAAILEGSKVFSKELMKKYGIPTAAYETFDDPQKAIAYIEEQNSYPAVIKADGLALGKGVIIAQDFEAAKEAVHSIMEDKMFGASGSRIVVEEFLTGPEVSVLSFCDGKTIVPMVSAMDHKRALDGDQGLNTGGMGTVAPNPYYTPAVAEECMKTIFLPTMEAMNQEGRPFRGVIFFGLMITPKGPKVIEYNCRFGDPETQVVLPLLKSDLLDIFEAVSEGRLAEVPVEFDTQKHAACVIEASGGYPQSYPKGLPISGLDENGQSPLATVYHAGTKLENGVFCTNGGRVLGITQTGDSLQEALDKAYAAVDTISFEGGFCRKDIGKRALEAPQNK
ncbi:MAG: phosphoribosylamine--glycine ligase [Massiliimalia sp.]|jgi:phosphoribosylamine--glycine ligase